MAFSRLSPVLSSLQTLWECILCDTLFIPPYTIRRRFSKAFDTSDAFQHAVEHFYEVIRKRHGMLINAKRIWNKSFHEKKRFLIFHGNDLWRGGREASEIN